jgi:hypothetical protein
MDRESDQQQLAQQEKAMLQRWQLRTIVLPTDT